MVYCQERRGSLGPVFHSRQHDAETALWILEDWLTVSAGLTAIS